MKSKAAFFGEGASGDSAGLQSCSFLLGRIQTGAIRSSYWSHRNGILTRPATLGSMQDAPRFEDATFSVVPELSGVLLQSPGIHGVRRT